MAVFAYRLMYRGAITTAGVSFDQPHTTADQFADAFGALLDNQQGTPPLPYPVELHVWAGEDTDRAPDAVHVRRRRVRSRELVAS